MKLKWEHKISGKEMHTHFSNPSFDVCPIFSSIGDKVYCFHKADLVDISNKDDMRLNLACEEFHPTEGFINQYTLGIPNGMYFTNLSKWHFETNSNRILIDTYPTSSGDIASSYYTKIFVFERGKFYVFADSKPQPQTTPAIKDTTDINQTFGEFNVKVKSPKILICNDIASEKEVWKLKIIPYLHTTMEESNGRLFFTTSRKNSHFYCVDISTGNVLYDYKMNGISGYHLRQNGLVYLSNESGCLTIIAEDTGKIVDVMDSGKIIDGSPMAIINNHFYTITTGENAGGYLSQYLVCYEL